MRLFAIVVALASLGGCAGFEQVTASRRDYLAYRETRVGRTPELRLAASARYLREQREGRFRGEVEAWFKSAEPEFYRLAHDRPSLLRAYLRALPEGPHAADAARRLDEFGQLNRYRGRREAESERFLERVETGLEQAESGRKKLLAELRELSRLLAATQAFGAPTSELDHELVYRLRLVPPAGVCNESSCRKEYRVTYGVPNAGKIAQRDAVFALNVELERGLVTKITVSGAGLWSRLGEAVDRVVVDTSNLQARAESIGRAAMLVEGAVEGSLPSAECRTDVVAPVVLARRCRGVELTMSAGGEGSEQDRLEIRPLPGERKQP